MQGTSRYKVKKQWGEIIPKLSVSDIPFRFVKEIKMFMTDGQILIAKNKRQFTNHMKENAEKGIFTKHINFTIEYNKLISRVERLYNKEFKS